MVPHADNVSITKAGKTNPWGCLPSQSTLISKLQASKEMQTIVRDAASKNKVDGI